MFYVIGLLCGKTLAMNAALPLPLSEQFFRFLDGEELTVADIDQAFAQALAAKEDLVALEIPFSYPGIDELLLVDGGDELCVTDENYDEYVRLVQDFTYGAKLEALRKQFLKGLFSVIENGVWDRLTACEKVMLLSGDTHEVTMGDLEAHVSFEHGYDAHCPQRIMLFETICEMDGRQKQHLFKFITGCERLPVGGLSALTPKITVARRVSREGQAPDETLPTASTCTHYFKLPPYSSKRILRDRIVLAITEGSIGFNLS
jgi:E3 ubiquitin-protein ligase TRIP12